jgi:2-dehydro-3-deoxyphosphogluconate aldolase/(4S)-4-hydroxy-2-oxoglutarate aldolase
MNAQELKALIKQEKLVPILRISDSEPVMDVTEAVVAADAKIIEFTTTIPGAVSLISRAKERFPNLIIGLGTVYNKQDAADGIKAGADFIVSPIFNAELVDTVKSLGKMLMLSGFTPTEIYNAWRAGADIVKLFPASEMAPSFIRELRGPMPDVDIFPTGGLNLISAIQFLANGAIAVGMGTNSLFKPNWIQGKQYGEITKNLRNAISRIQKLSI